MLSECRLNPHHRHCSSPFHNRKRPTFNLVSWILYHFSYQGLHGSLENYWDLLPLSPFTMKFDVPILNFGPQLLTTHCTPSAVWPTSCFRKGRNQANFGIESMSKTVSRPEPYFQTSYEWARREHFYGSVEKAELSYTNI